MVVALSVPIMRDILGIHVLNGILLCLISPKHFHAYCIFFIKHNKILSVTIGICFRHVMDPNMIKRIYLQIRTHK